REDALALVEQAVELHSDLTGQEDDPVAKATTLRDKARAVVDTLGASGWLQEGERSDWQKLVLFDPNGVLIMQAIRKIAFPDAAVFSDKLVNACTTLANSDALGEEPWAQIESSIASIQSGLVELRAMQKSIERHTKQQLAAATLAENLSLVFDRFAERIGRNCYAQLVRARLPSKLAEARSSIENLNSKPDLLTSMQTEVMHRGPELTPEGAMAKVRLRLNELEELLYQVEPLADAIDRRTAEFARRSQARFQYLQETTSENRARVQDFFEILNRHFAGSRLIDIYNLGIVFPVLLLHDARLFGGLESLYAPRLLHAVGEIEPLEDPDPAAHDRALVQLGGTLRDSLTVRRANRFVETLPGGCGTRIESPAILRDHVHNDEDVADLLACLLHSAASDARFRIEVPRR